MALFNSQQAAATPRPAAPQEGESMSLKNYDVEINGHRTTLQLSDEDARALGLHVPAHRAPEAEPVAEAPAVDDPETKAHTPENKAHTPANKNADKRSEAAARAFGGGSKDDGGPDAG